jgi:hypothetical protein
MRLILCFLIAALAWPQGVMRVQRRAAAPPASISVIDGTAAESSSAGGSNVTVTTSGHALNVAAGDDLWAFINVRNTTCPTITLVGGTNTFTQVTGSTCTENTWTGGQWVTQFHVKNASANASETYTLTVGTATSGVYNVSIIQIRGGAHADPDVVASCNGATGGAGNGCWPGNPMGTSSTFTTTSADSIVVTGVATQYGSVIAPTTNGCFGSTGTIPPNMLDNSGSYSTTTQYKVLSSTATDKCLFTQADSWSFATQVAVYH